ncbi:DNA cytosine methyltransferase [Selenomonas bovis]|uniref:DNA cytosine methyltransferase n=1 Tax=Selenomonas bovis TaxID=416586 RepID=UPI0005638030|nr:DNA cytosine methyltransferase [Selenomonas bovis]MCI6752015.1 DNA cytosine methyltransferase [Selenomonas bovis]MDY6298513.1 DNA cytosine methyltransferase [Selenomonadaceae bacterium]
MVLRYIKKSRQAISLFSGGMGLDIGLQDAGIRIAIGQDLDSSCIKTIRENGHAAIEGDITQLRSETLLEQAGLRIGEPFLICGGPPCQPFSTAGKRLGVNDPRGSLFIEFVRMIREIRPRFFVMENVKGLVSSKLVDRGGKSEDTTVLDVVLEQFAHIGYHTVHGILDAVNYGVPQFRERLIILGSRDNEQVFLPVPTHFQIHQNPLYRWNVLGDAIRDLEDDVGECASFSQERLHFLKMVPEGGNWRDLPEEAKKIAMGGAYYSGGGKVGFYRRLSYKQPSPTLVTSPVQKASMFCHPVKDRPLSVREYARIQQFPEDWRFVGTTAAKYRQIGNAVPVGLARAVGQALLACADGDAVIETKRLRGTGVHNKIIEAMKM